jgi:hypothetical protein
MIKKALVVLVTLVVFWYLKIYFITNSEAQNPGKAYMDHSANTNTHDNGSREEGAEINHADGYRSGVGFSNPTGAKQISTPNAPIFHCDGRTHCSQMRSCEEAEYFLKNCPNTKMDGDGDQIPCEGQWCHY